MVGPYEKEVKKFVKAAQWLGPDDQLMLFHVRTIAQSLDKQLEDRGVVQSALCNSFKTALSSLLERKPKAAEQEEIEEDDDLTFS